MKEDINLYDTSDYDENNIYNLPLVNKKVIGKMKDENKGNIMTEYVGLKSKICRKKNNSTRPLSSKIKANAGEKQLNSSVGTKQLNSTGENNSTRQHERNNSTQQEKTTQLGNMNETSQLASKTETTQLVSRNETTQLCTAVDRLHRLYSRIGFFYLLMLKCSFNLAI
ncbi:hypothetical protein TNCV_2351631 [Trichonephila clavipes]|nr:hypothetical protein TNCV_2351631 [Trichonephila clavipes]